MLFGKKRKPQLKSIQRDEKSYIIPYSKGFRGFKRFPMRVHGDRVSEKNNESLYNNDFSCSSFKFVCFNDDSGNRVAFLYIDGYKMGTIYDSEQLYAIEHEMIEMIHIEPKEESIIGSKKTETRHRISVLVKYSDEG